MNFHLKNHQHRSPFQELHVFFFFLRVFLSGQMLARFSFNFCINESLIRFASTIRSFLGSRLKGCSLFIGNVPVFLNPEIKFSFVSDGQELALTVLGIGILGLMVASSQTDCFSSLARLVAICILGAGSKQRLMVAECAWHLVADK